jgi:hypothetical protein
LCNACVFQARRDFAESAFALSVDAGAIENERTRDIRIRTAK